MKAGSENKFAVILQAARSTTSAEPAVITPAEPRRPVAPKSPTAVMPEPSKRMGRPAGKGKKSDPTFRQVTAYIPQELHNNATIALRLANQVRVDADKEDFSELLTRLLADWYEKQNFYRPAK